MFQLANNGNPDKLDELLQETHGIVTKKIDFGPTVTFLIVQTEPGKVFEVEKRLQKCQEVQLIQHNSTFHITANEEQLQPIGSQSLTSK